MASGRFHWGDEIDLSAFCFQSLFPAHFQKMNWNKKKPEEYTLTSRSRKCVYIVPYDVSVVNFIAASKREKKTCVRKRSKVGDKSCCKSVFEQNETNFFGVFCCRCIASHFRYRGICQWESSNCLNGFQMNHTNKNQSFEGRLSMFPIEKNCFFFCSKFKVFVIKIRATRNDFAHNLFRIRKKR